MDVRSVIKLYQCIVPAWWCWSRLRVACDAIIRVLPGQWNIMCDIPWPYRCPCNESSIVFLTAWARPASSYAPTMSNSLLLWLGIEGDTLALSHQVTRRLLATIALASLRGTLLCTWCLNGAQKLHDVRATCSSLSKACTTERRA